MRSIRYNRSYDKLPDTPINIYPEFFGNDSIVVSMGDEQAWLSLSETETLIAQLQRAVDDFDAAKAAEEHKAELRMQQFTKRINKTKVEEN